MKLVTVTYGCGYGQHETDFEIEDDATEDEIEEWAREAALERFDWSFKVSDQEGL